MAREQEVARYSRMEQELVAARQREADALSREQAAQARYERAECERIVMGLESEHIDLDRAAEVEDMLRRDAESRKSRADHIRKYYRRAITDPTLMQTGDVPGDDIYQGLTRDRFKQVKQYSREHPGMSWDEAVSKCPK